jgi:putative hydrolase of the HAD superfamily
VTSDADALVLDFGGVITRTLFETHDITERSLGLPAGTLTWMGPFDPDNDPLWQRMQADEISEREYWQERIGEVGRLIGEQWSSINSFMRRARAVEPAAFVRPEAVVAIEEVNAAGKRVAVLSNNSISSMDRSSASACR